MCYVDMNTLPHLAVSDDLRHLNADRIAIDVEDDARTAVVEGVRHALLNGRVDNDVDIVAALELRKISRDIRHTFGLVSFGIFVAGTMAVTPRLCSGGAH